MGVFCTYMLHNCMRTYIHMHVDTSCMHNACTHAYMHACMHSCSRTCIHRQKLLLSLREQNVDAVTKGAILEGCEDKSTSEDAQHRHSDVCRSLGMRPATVFRLAEGTDGNCLDAREVLRSMQEAWNSRHFLLSSSPRLSRFVSK